MQTLGTEWGRALSPTLWVNVWARSLDGLERVVADDVRFDNEVAAVRELGGTVIEVQRPGLARLAGGHASETGTTADLIVKNVGAPVDLGAALDGLLAADMG